MELRLFVYLSRRQCNQLTQCSRWHPMLILQRSFVSCFGGVSDARYAAEGTLQVGWATGDEWQSQS